MFLKLRPRLPGRLGHRARQHAPRCGHTYLLFVVGELAGLAVLLDLVVVHREAGSLVACARAVFFYVSVFWRLAFLLLLLLLQDSFCDLSEDEKAKKERKKKKSEPSVQKVRPLSNQLTFHHFGYINMKYGYFISMEEGGGKSAESGVLCAVR